jgi:hypothetical protein
MRDFLRRLAPRGADDATRAVAVLPSPYTGDAPLRALGDSHVQSRRNDEEATGFATDASFAAEAIDTAPAQSHPVDGSEPLQGEHRVHGAATARQAQGQAASSMPLAFEGNRPGFAADQPRSLKDPTAELDSTSRSAVPNVMSSRMAARGLPSATSSPAPARIAQPLSPSILAERTRHSRDENQVVHVTIGRIDVVAHTEPAPAVRRNPTPRQPTVTLADYLRGGKRSSR